MSNKNFFIFRDLIKINTIFSALYFILFYIYSFTLPEIVFTRIDFINSFLIFLYFILNILFDIKHLKRKDADISLIVYFTIYLFLFVSFYLFLIFNTLLFIISFTGFIFSIILYYYLPFIPLLSKQKYSLRVLSLLISYITTIFSCLYLYYEGFNIVILFILSFLGVFNIFTHIKYQNYPSMIMGVFSFSFLIFFFLFEFITPYFGYESLLVGTYIMSIVGIFSMYFFFWHDLVDYIVLSISIMVIQLFGIVSFFSFSSFDILTFGSILLLESITFFALYYKINPFFKIHEPINQKHGSGTHNHHH